MESGHAGDSGNFSIHGTVVANTDSWVFYIFIYAFRT